MNDLISRHDAIDVKAEFLNPNVKRETEEQTTIDRAYAKGWNDCNSHWIDGIENLPSAERIGHWIEGQTAGQRFVKCSRCGHIEFDDTPNYCEDCGARMVEGEEE